MDFTREPIIETVITPKEGWTLVIRNSKSVGQEEFFVDAVEVITFGSATFYRTQERPKAFILPISDYEVVEVRETRMVLKNITLDRSIKIGSGKEFSARRETVVEKPALVVQEVEPAEKEEEVRLDRKRDRKRNFRRKRAREEVPFREEGSADLDSAEALIEGGVPALTSAISNLLPPPPTLISETIARYKDNALFKGAFFSKEEVAAEKEKRAQQETQQPEDEVASQPEQPDAPEEVDVPQLPQMSLDYPVYGIESVIPTPQQDQVEQLYAEQAVPIQVSDQADTALLADFQGTQEQLEMSFHLEESFSEKESTALAQESDSLQEDKDFL